MKIETFVLGQLATNCYLVYCESSRKGVLIDPAVPAVSVKEFVENEGLEVLYTVNTHGHADHIGGDEYFGFPVLIHEADEPCLRDPFRNLAAFTASAFPQVGAHRSLRGGEIIEVGELRLEVIHTPGHSPGSISILSDEAVFSGDTLFFEGVGRCDLPGGDREEIVSSIRQKLFSLPDSTVVYPGHGEKTSIAHERTDNPFVC